jgi:hypothetical protein
MSTFVKVWRTLARVLLSLFVLGQLVFLVSSNFLNVEEPLRSACKDFIWGDPPPADRHTAWSEFQRWVQGEAKDTEPTEYTKGKDKVHETYFAKTKTYDKRWSQLTGQPQNWSLFAPDIVQVAPFPAVEMRWDDEDWPDWAEPPVLLRARPAPVVLLSENEPRDRRWFAHVSGFRYRKFEGNITPFAEAADGRFDPETSGWRRKIRDRVDDEPVCMRNYLRWRLQVFQEANPRLPPPTQVILLVRAYKIPLPPGPLPLDADTGALGLGVIAHAPKRPGPEAWYWYELGEDRVARYLPAAPLDAPQFEHKYELVERFNPEWRHFERVEK